MLHKPIQFIIYQHGLIDSFERPMDPGKGEEQ